jgi:hypothetical protein
MEVPASVIPFEATTAQWGNVFLIAGQSNASGRGTNSQSWSHATLTPWLFDNAYTFRILADPTDSAIGQVDAVSNDSSEAAGSVWPLVATSLLASTNARCGFVPCAKGATSITAWLPGADRQDRTTLYGSMIYRATQVMLLTGTSIKAVLWWQGESDAIAGMSQATYNAHLDTLTNAIASDLGCKLMAAKLQTCSGADVTTVNAAIAEAWADNPNVLIGPDLSGLSTAPDDLYHLITDAKLASAASLWWDAIKAVFGYP